MIHHMNEKEMMLTTGFYVTAELKIKDPNKILETRNALSALCKITLEQESGVPYFNSINAKMMLLVYCFGNASTQKMPTIPIFNNPIPKHILHRI